MARGMWNFKLCFSSLTIIVLIQPRSVQCWKVCPQCRRKRRVWVKWIKKKSCVCLMRHFIRKLWASSVDKIHPWLCKKTRETGENSHPTTTAKQNRILGARLLCNPLYYLWISLSRQTESASCRFSWFTNNNMEISLERKRSGSNLTRAFPAPSRRKRVFMCQ